MKENIIASGQAYKVVQGKIDVLKDFMRIYESNPDMTLGSYMKSKGIKRSDFLQDAPGGLQMLKGSSSHADVNHALSMLHKSLYHRRSKMLQHKLNIMNAFIVTYSGSKMIFADYLKAINETPESFLRGLPKNLQDTSIFTLTADKLTPYAQHVNLFHLQEFSNFADTAPENISSKSILREFDKGVTLDGFYNGEGTVTSRTTSTPGGGNPRPVGGGGIAPRAIGAIMGNTKLMSKINTKPNVTPIFEGGIIPVSGGTVTTRLGGGITPVTPLGQSIFGQPIPSGLPQPGGGQAVTPPGGGIPYTPGTGVPSGIDPATGIPYSQEINPATGMPYTQTPGTSVANNYGLPYGATLYSINPATGLPYSQSINPATGVPYGAPAGTTPQSIDPATGVPYYMDNQINPNTGLPYNASPAQVAAYQAQQQYQQEAAMGNTGAPPGYGGQPMCQNSPSPYCNSQPVYQPQPQYAPQPQYIPQQAPMCCNNMICCSSSQGAECGFEGSDDSGQGAECAFEQSMFDGSGKQPAKKKPPVKMYNANFFECIVKGFDNTTNDITKGVINTENKVSKINLHDVLNVINRFNPVTVAMREAFKGVVDLNGLALATNMGKIKDKNDHHWGKIKDLWEGFGGNVSNLEKVIDGAKNKKMLGADGSGYYNCTDPATATGCITAASIIAPTSVIIGDALKAYGQKEAADKAKSDAETAKETVDANKNTNGTLDPKTQAYIDSIVNNTNAGTGGATGGGSGASAVVMNTLNKYKKPLLIVGGVAVVLLLLQSFLGEKKVAI